MTTTRTSSRLHTADHVGPSDARPARAPAGSVLVGVDTAQDPHSRTERVTGRPVGAVAWAVAEAQAAGRPLHLLTACAHLEPLPADFGDRAPPYAEPGRQQAAASLLELVAGLPHDLSAPVSTQATAETAPGRAAEVLLEASPGAGILVVGQRRLGVVRRWAESSTSITVAGHSRVPVVVVPDGWPPPGARDTTDPVTVGLDLRAVDLEASWPGTQGRHRRSPRLDHAETLVAFAASYAQRHGVALHVLCSWDAPAELAWSAARLIESEDHRAAEIRRWMDGLDGVPVGLDVRVEARTGRPSEHLLTAASSSSLTVVGRRRGPLEATGPRLGSTTRLLLHHTPGPVAVVPHIGG